MSHLPHKLYIILLCLLGCALVLTYLSGTGDLSNDSLWKTFVELRAIRSSGAFLAGASLAVAGVLVQGLFQNPIASPSVLGTTGGASLGGHLSLWLLFWTMNQSEISPLAEDALMPIGTLLGAFLSLGILLILMRKKPGLLTLLLTGFILSSFFLSLSSFITSLAQESWSLGRAIVSYSLGTLNGIRWGHSLVAFPLVIVGTLASLFWAKHLDMLLTGEQEAQTFGVNIKQVQTWIVVWVAVLTGAAVSIGGNIGFVGLIIPHLIRPFTGPKHTHLIIASFLAGGIFLVLCDSLCRILPTQSEMPLGVLTSLIGAPVFLLLLRNIMKERLS